eukprot:GILJ01016460.1.p1 GENE.GILJ01016460.1~~GILJ01016460.1.p1  ORF type:complete len:213 (+),score=32.23 GILJ01016460.1:25-639(+)
MQVLQDLSDGGCILWTRWGVMDEIGDMNKGFYDTHEEAISAYDRLLKTKLDDNWEAKPQLNTQEQGAQLAVPDLALSLEDSADRPSENEDLQFITELSAETLDGVATNATAIAHDVTELFDVLRQNLSFVATTSSSHLQIYQQLAQTWKDTAERSVESMDIFIWKCQQLEEQLQKTDSLHADIKTLRKNVDKLDKITSRSSHFR